MKGSLRDLKVDLELAILPSRLGITILRHPPLMKETLGVVAIVGVGRTQRRGWRKRYSVRRLTGPGERTKTVIYNKPIGESE